MGVAEAITGYKGKVDQLLNKAIRQCVFSKANQDGNQVHVLTRWKSEEAVKKLLSLICLDIVVYFFTIFV